MLAEGLCEAVVDRDVPATVARLRDIDTAAVEALTDRTAERDRLQSLYLRRLRSRTDQVGDPLTDTDRKALARLLDRFAVGRVELEAAAEIPNPQVGMALHAHATTMDDGQLLVGASMAGWPRIGEVAAVRPAVEGSGDAVTADSAFAAACALDRTIVAGRHLAP